MYKLSVCAIARNEGRYIQEWIEFLMLQGVEHFYIYNNESVDDTVSKLKPYTNVVTLVDWRINPPQFKAYNDCLNRYGKETEWLAFIDCDEFLYSPTISSIPKALDKICKASPYRVGAVGAHWLLFGANGHKTYSPDLVIDRFTGRQKNVNDHVKSIVRPSAAQEVGLNPHYFVLKSGYYAVDENGKKMPEIYGVTPKGTASLLRVAHFHVKSKEEYLKRKRESPDPGHGRGYTDEQLEHMFEVHNVNDVMDLSLKRFSSAIKKALMFRKGI